MNIFITGICGFIGHRLADDLSRRGHRIWGSTSQCEERGPRCLDVPPLNFRFGEAPPIAIFRGVDALVHLAHDRRAGRGRDVTVGTIALAEAARMAGVTRQVFVSSLSARPDATSEYGRTKLEIEAHFHDHSDVIVRPGMVIGNGGVFGRILDMARRHPVLPLPDGGRTRLPIIGTRSLCRCVEQVLHGVGGIEVNLFYPEMPSLREIMTAVCRVIGKRRLFVPIPASLLLAPLVIFEKFRLKSPIDVENLRGYLTSRDPIHAPTTEYLDGAMPLLDELLRESLAET